ncbi:MAG: hypothetical protein GC152_05940 [Alphaproteobacteria bacterium]|nr:hypothetical protein [Alphaproteobacteria bacterium]
MPARQKRDFDPIAVIYGAPLLAIALLLVVLQFAVRIVTRPRLRYVATAASGVVVFLASLFLFFWGRTPQATDEILAEMQTFVSDRLLNPVELGFAALGVAAYFAARLWQYQKDRLDGRPSYPQAVFDSILGGRYGGACLGIGGVGKTTLLQYLHYDHLRSSRHNAPLIGRRTFKDLDIEEMLEGTYRKPTERRADDAFEIGSELREYNVTGDAEQIKIAHRRYMFDVRGQEVGRSAHWAQALGEVWPSHQRSMIVNVMTYGYSASVMKRSDIIAELIKGDAGRTLAAFQEEKRQEEIAGLHDIIAAVDDAWPQGYRGRLAFKNMINMAGFWWDRRKDVEAYYRSQPFRDFEEALRYIVESRGGRVIFEPYIPVSFLFDDMSAKTGREGDGARVLVYKVQNEARDALKAATQKAIMDMRADLFRLNWPREGGRS